MRRALCILAVMGWVSAGLTFPQIQNPSFEDSPGIVWPGWTSVPNQPGLDGFYNLPIGLGCPGWNQKGACGINPVIVPHLPVKTGDTTGNYTADNGIVFVTYPFADNGQTPHGTNVLWMQNGGFVTQSVPGFEAGKTYVLNYRYNMRAGTGPAQLRITLGGKVIADHGISRVQGGGNFTKPYYFGRTDEFKAQNSGSYELKLEDIVDAPDSAAVVDDLSFEELGDLRVLSAIRADTDETRVTVKFSDDVPATEATNIDHYVIEPDTVVTKAVQIDPKTIELTATPLTDPNLTYKLTVVGMLDKTGKRMTFDNSWVNVQIPKLPDPRLTIVSTAEGVKISWPEGGYSGYYLQASETLLPGSWADYFATEVKSENGTRYTVATPDKPFLFFRLVR